MKSFQNWFLILVPALLFSPPCPGQNSPSPASNAAPALTISGTVFNPFDAPAAGVVILVASGSRESETPIKSDADGRYTLHWTGPPTNRGMPNLACSLVARDVAHNFASSLLIETTTTNLDIHLQPGLTISATVRDPNGNPIPNATIYVNYSPGDNSHGTSIPTQDNKADAQGRFQITALPHGCRYLVQAMAPGYGMGSYQNVQETQTLSTHFDLPPFVLKFANLKLAGQVLDADGQPVPAVRVGISGKEQVLTNVLADATGHFSAVVCEGSVNASARAQGAYGSAQTVGGDTNLIVRIVKSKNAFMTEDNGGLVIKGKVFDLTGTPAPGVQVSFHPGHYPGQPEYAEAMTDNNGRYALKLEFIPYIAFTGSTGRIDPTNCVLARDLGRNLAAVHEMSENPTNLDLNLQPGIILSGFVKDTKGAPITNALVNLGFYNRWTGGQWYELAPRPVPVDAQGLFSIPALPRGHMFVIDPVTAKGYGSTSLYLSTNFTQTNYFEFHETVLKTADRKLAGQVLDSDGKAFAGAVVRFEGTGQPGGLNTTKTDARGHFAFDGVCEGELQVSAYFQGPPRLLTTAGGAAKVQSGDTNIILRLQDPRARTSGLQRGGVPRPGVVQPRGNSPSQGTPAPLPFD
ncbi:MAG: carboxypeptidase regulatory-like domain-containing protein [Verrucomicrobiota bacterium]|jgi:protocatechuate 3,4-dioxygenase beta subunit